MRKVFIKYINDCYSKYDVVKLDELDKLKESYYETSKTQKLLFLYPLVKYIVRGEEVYVEAELADKSYNNNNLNQIKDNRIVQVLSMIQKTLLWAKSVNKPIIQTTLYFWMSDRIPWYNEIDTKFPIYVFATPKNKNFILFPDNSFECMTIDEKYNGECYDWNQTKAIIINKSNSVKFAEKTNKIFFKGTSTSSKNTQIRENLFAFSKSSEYLDIRLDGWYAYIGMDNFCKYKFLLNLPGNYPWSNRLKYLFLMKSIVINVDVESEDIKTNIVDQEWISFINIIVKPDTHYINLKFKYYYNNDKNKNKNEKINYQQSVKIFNQLESIYKSNTEKYNSMIDNGYQTVSELTNDNIYEYIYECMVKNSSLKFV
jgi:hypothetical protein